MGHIAPWLVVACSACGDNLATSARDETLTFASGGVDRIAIVHVPAGIAQPPLVISLHASGSVAAGQQAAFALDALADTAGFATAYGQGAIPLGSGFEWHLPGEPLVSGAPEPAGPDDVAYVAELIRQVASRYGIDRHRVYVTGFSGGGRLASQVGCDLTGVAAIAPIAGVRFPGNCVRDTQSVIAFHGTADATAPYEGHGLPYWTYGVRDAMLGWAANDNCGDPIASRAAATVELATFPDCRGNATVELYTLETEGHAIPVGVDANTVMWDAFQRHVLP